MNLIFMNQENQNFDELVDRWVYAAVNNGVTNFNSLLNSLPGVYPSVALCSLVSLPPIGTRLGIESDMQRFFEWSKKLGLSLIKEEKGILPYTSPPFEINALRAENFHNLNREWRRGDLAVFVKREHTLIERPLVLPDSEDKWFEEMVQEVRIKLKPYDVLEFKDPKLLTVVKNNIFPAVSRREPRRRIIEVWTSGNRVFACEGRFVLQEILRELSSGQSATMILSEKLNRILTKEEEILINESKEQMLKIINTEREENYVFANGNK